MSPAAGSDTTSVADGSAVVSSPALVTTYAYRSETGTPAAVTTNANKKAINDVYRVVLVDFVALFIFGYVNSTDAPGDYFGDAVVVQIIETDLDIEAAVGLAPVGDDTFPYRLEAAVAGYEHQRHVVPTGRRTVHPPVNDVDDDEFGRQFLNREYLDGIGSTEVDILEVNNVRIEYDTAYFGGYRQAPFGRYRRRRFGPFNGVSFFCGAVAVEVR
jgi:hypothetical protein